MPIYRVVIADNFHYQDEDEYTSGGEFAPGAEAISACERIVDDSLAARYRDGMTASALTDAYRDLGADPFIRAIDGPPVPFSAWTYAESRAPSFCRG